MSFVIAFSSIDNGARKLTPCCRYSENITYRPRWSPPLPTPENGPPFLSITKQTPEEWCHVTTSIPSDQEGVGAIDCHVSRHSSGDNFTLCFV